MSQASTSVTVGDVTTVTPLTTATQELSMPLQQNGPAGPDGCAAITGQSGAVAFNTAVISIQARLKSGAAWKKIAVMDRGDNSMKNGNIALTDDTPFDFFVPNVAMYSDIKIVLESIVSGKIVCDLESMPAVYAPAIIMSPTLAVATTAQTIGLASATAFVVGPNGTTNPLLTLDTSTSSAATGLKVTGAAAGSNVAILVTSSGGGDGLTVTAKAGSGAQAGGIVTLTGGAGGGTSGAGGALTFTGGAGTAGNAAGGAVGSIGGAGQGSAAGGAVVNTGGAGGATGAGGAASLTGGAGGATSGTGGAATVVAGAGAAGNSAGGVASVAGGAGQGTGAGGVASVTGGASGSGATGNGGAVSVTGGAAASTAGTGGAASLIGGAGTTTGAGGAITITSGAAGNTGVAGAVNISVGSATAGIGSAITITAGNGAGSTNGGGNINLIPGTAVSTGTPGEVVVNSVAGTFEVTYTSPLMTTAVPASATAQPFYIATRAMRVKKAYCSVVTHGTSETIAITKDASGGAPGSGTNVLAAVMTPAASNTPVTQSASSTIATCTLAAGDRLSFLTGGTIGSAAGLTITVLLTPC